MRLAFAGLVVLHGAIHILGFVKAFGFAPIAQLQRPIGRPLGLLWLVAATGFLLAAAFLLIAPRHWWIPALVALLLSQALIISVWSDAKFGTIANVIVLVPLCLTWLDLRPGILRATYERDVDRGLVRTSATMVVTEKDLAPLPILVATYLRRVGVVGKPHVQNFRAIFRGQIRSSVDSSWMTVSAEQFNFYDEPSRLFFLRASRAGLPIQVLHRYIGSAATMQVRIGGLFTVADARGPLMDQSETVTMLNDLCLIAPRGAALRPDHLGIHRRAYRTRDLSQRRTDPARRSDLRRERRLDRLCLQRPLRDGRCHRATCALADADLRIRHVSRYAPLEKRRGTLD